MDYLIIYFIIGFSYTQFKTIKKSKILDFLYTLFLWPVGVCYELFLLLPKKKNPIERIDDAKKEEKVTGATKEVKDSDVKEVLEALEYYNFYIKRVPMEFGKTRFYNFKSQILKYLITNKFDTNVWVNIDHIEKQGDTYLYPIEITHHGDKYYFHQIKSEYLDKMVSDNCEVRPYFESNNDRDDFSKERSIECFNTIINFYYDYVVLHKDKYDEVIKSLWKMFEGEYSFTRVNGTDFINISKKGCNCSANYSISLRKLNESCITRREMYEYMQKRFKNMDSFNQNNQKNKQK